jgi:hypothetical protein
MSLRNPRGREQNNWGVFASLAACPNGSATAVANNEVEGVLEVGDTAYITGSGPCHCTSIGTYPSGGDAVWALTGTTTTPPIRFVFNELGLGTDAQGTTPVVIGAVYLENGVTILGKSNALLGTIAGGTGTVQLRRQGTGALLAGASWDYTGVGIGDDALAADVAIAATDWYTIELVGDALDTVAVCYGLTLNF